MVLKGRLNRLEKSAKASLQDAHDPVAEEVCRLLSDQELRLIADILHRELDGAEFLPTESNASPEEKAALDKFYELYEEVRGGD
jgi:hypothetical protein